MIEKLTQSPESFDPEVARQRLAALMLQKRYELLDLIAAGGMAAVYRARHLLLDRLVAAKILTLELAETRAMFLREGRALAKLRHPNVVEVYDLDEVGGVPFMVMELLEGESLDDRLRREGRLSYSDTCAIMKQMLRGLSAAHLGGIVHRDIKPSNIFIETTSDGEVVKLIDFGVCTEPGRSTLLAGTPHYLAPEQLLGKDLDARTDLWAVGVTLYETLTGRMPFRGEDVVALQKAVLEETPVSPRELVPELPAEVAAAILRLLEKNPDDRFASAEEALAACGRAMTGDSTIVSEPPRDYALIAYEDAARAAVLKGLVGNLGLVGLVANTLESAKDLLKEIGPPRLAVVDLTSARGDGFRLLHEVRAMSSRDTTALVVTSLVPAFLNAAFESPEFACNAAVSGDDLVALNSALVAALRGEVVAPTKSAERRVHDPQRLAAVKEVGRIGDGPTDDVLQKLVHEVADVFHVPIALVSLVSADRQWFKAHFGLAGQLLQERGTPIDQAFCRHVVESASTLVVEDAREHPAFRDNPLVQSGAVSSYVGAPITTEAGHTLGTLCLIDSIPHSFGAQDVDALAMLARRVAGELALLAQQARAQDAPEEAEEDDAASASAMLEVDEEHLVVDISKSFATLFGVDRNKLLGLSREAVIYRLAEHFAEPDDFVRATRVARGGPFMAHGLFRFAPPKPGRVRWLAKPLSSTGTKFRIREWFIEIP